MSPKIITILSIDDEQRELQTINLWFQIENSNSASGMLPGSVSVVGGPNEESNTSTGKDEMAKASDWSYYEDIFQVVAVKIRFLDFCKTKNRTMFNF